MPTKTNIATAQILSVQRDPYRSSKVCSKNGKAKPAMQILDMSNSNDRDAHALLTPDTRPSEYNACRKSTFAYKPLGQQDDDGEV